MKNSNEKFFTTADVADLMGKSQRTVERMTRLGQIPGRVAPGGHIRYHRATIEAWVELGMPLAKEQHGDTLA